MTTVNIKLYKNLRNARNNKNLTREQLGELVGVSKDAVKGYELNRSYPTLVSFAKLSKVLEIDSNTLLFGDVKKKNLITV